VFIVSVTIDPRSTARDPLPRDPPVLTPTLVLSLRVPLCDRQWIDGSLADQLRRRHIHRRLDWTPWFDRGLRSASDHHDRMRAFININSDLYQDRGGIIHIARGLNFNIVLGRPCCFSIQRIRIRCCRFLECRFDDCFGGIVRNCVYNNPVKFRRIPMEESPAIYDIPDPCQVRTGIWTSLGRRVQRLARTSFGRSNR
jgi:hypothetical protein